MRCFRHFSTAGRWSAAPGSRFAIAVGAPSALLFLALIVLGADNLTRTPLLFVVLQVVACGIGFGLRGGLAAAALGSALIAYGSALSPPGLISRVLVLALVGGVVGLFADERQRLLAALAMEHDLAPVLLGIVDRDVSSRT